jgi:glycosyltransferase involved in cell wall biosynthesis
MIAVNNVVYFLYRPVPSRSADTIHAMKMCQALQQEGYQATLCAPLIPGEDASPQALWHWYGVQTPFQVKLFPRFPGLRRYDVALRGVRYAGSLSDVVVLSRFPLASMIAGKLRIPTIVETHDRPPSGMGERYLRWSFQQPGFRRLCVITQPLRELYLTLYPDLLTADDFVVAADGVSLEQFVDLPDKHQLRQDLNLPHDQFIAGYTGQLFPGRGIDLILELAARLPAVMFMLVGGMPDDIAYWRRQMQRRRLTNVHFIGFVPNTELPAYLAAADCLLMPYQRKIAMEGGVGDTAKFASPMKMFEYMASRRVILSGDIPVFREVLNDDNALLLDPEDIDAWQTALQRVIDNPAWARSFAEQAFKDVQQYTWRKRARKLLEMLHQ